MKTNDTIKETLLSAEALAGVLSLSKRQIFRLNVSGKIPSPVRIGGSVRWRKSDIDKWLDLDCCDRETFELHKELK